MASARRWAALEALVSRRRAGGALSYRTVEYAHGGVALCGCAVRRRGAEEVRCAAEGRANTQNRGSKNFSSAPLPAYVTPRSYLGVCCTKSKSTSHASGVAACHPNIALKTAPEIKI